MWKESYTGSEVETVVCPGCGATERRLITSEHSLDIGRCTRCGLAYVSPRLKEPHKNYWVDENILTSKYAAVFADIRKHDRYENYQEHGRLLRRLKPSGKLLDVGTHCGFFLAALQNHPWERYGIEPSPTLTELAREKYGLRVACSALETAPYEDGSFDILTIIDVLEHVAEPQPFLRGVKRLLKPDGVVFIKTPNFKWNLLKDRFLSRDRFDIFDAREHVVQYEEHTLRRMLNNAGFADVRFHIARPIQTLGQTGRWWRFPVRSAAFLLASAAFMATRRVTALAPDLACIASAGNS